MDIRNLTPQDANQVATLWLSCTREVASVEPIYTPGISFSQLEEMLRLELQSGARIGWGYFHANELTAYVTCRLEEEAPIFVPRRFVYIIDLDVSAPYRGKGLARQLLQKVEKFAKDQGIHRIELAYAATDARAKQVWEKLGFKPHFVYAHKLL